MSSSIAGPGIAGPRIAIPVIGIVGGGFTGAVVALHLAKQRSSNPGVRIVIFEPRETLGAGLAYDTAEPEHRINVPAAKMSAYPDDPESFARWLAETDALADDPHALVGGDAYPRRKIFGRYVAAQIAPWLASGFVEHRRAHVEDVVATSAGWTVRTSDGREQAVVALVLAVSHPSPSLPRSLERLAGHPKLIADATRPDALLPIGKHDSVLVIGNGLTSADIIATLRGRGHAGRITAISRRGLRSRGHAEKPQEPFGDFLADPPARASALLRRVRATVREAVRQGLSWHAVLDAVRGQGQRLWQGLPIGERQRIARHVRPFWDVHRFRIAPQVERALDAAIADGGLTVRAARILSVEPDGERIRVGLKERHVREQQTVTVDAVVVTTGPAHGTILESQGFLARLAGTGHLVACPTGLGILVDAGGRAVSMQGVSADTLFIAGPLARGTVGELMGLPQVAEHAAAVAAQLAALPVARAL